MRPDSLLSRIAENILTHRTAVARFAKFCCVGIFGTIVEGGFFLLFIRILRGRGGAMSTNVLAPTIAFEISVVGNFALSAFWVWRERNASLLHSCWKYHLQMVGTFVLRLFMFNALVWLFSASPSHRIAHYYGAYALSIAVATVINFLSLDKIVFSGRHPESTSDESWCPRT